MLSNMYVVALSEVFFSHINIWLSESHGSRTQPIFSFAYSKRGGRRLQREAQCQHTFIKWLRQRTCCSFKHYVHVNAHPLINLHQQQFLLHVYPILQKIQKYETQLKYVRRCESVNYFNKETISFAEFELLACG